MDRPRVGNILASFGAANEPGVLHCFRLKRFSPDVKGVPSDVGAPEEVPGTQEKAAIPIAVAQQGNETSRDWV
jgi:hypothetical protein